MYTDRHIDIREKLLQELVHTVIEAEKSHNTPSASWTTRKAGGIIQSKDSQWCTPQSKTCLRTENQQFKSKSLKAHVQGQEMVNFPAQADKEKEFTPSFTFLLHLSPPWVDLITYSTEKNANLFQKNPHRSPRNNVFLAIWTSLSSVKQTPKINHHNEKEYTLNSIEQFLLPFTLSVNTC